MLVPLYRQNEGFWSIFKVPVTVYSVQAVNPLSRRINNPFSASIMLKDLFILLLTVKGTKAVHKPLTVTVL